MNDEPYTTYANAYDALGQSRWGAALAHFALEATAERGLAPRTALDLACGTGAAALVFAGAGLRTAGLDRSAGMLRAARQKAATAGVRLPLVRGDLRSFAFRRPFDLIVCAYDSLNYLTDPAELRVALGCVRDALAPRGLFVCDLTTRYAYTGELDGVAHDLDLGDLGYRWLTTWDAAAALATTTLSVRRGAGAWRSERHRQRPYAPAEMAEALHLVGIRPLATHGTTGDAPAATPPDPTAPRVIYVAAREN